MFDCVYNNNLKENSRAQALGVDYKAKNHDKKGARKALLVLERGRRKIKGFIKKLLFLLPGFPLLWKGRQKDDSAEKRKEGPCLSVQAVK